MTNQTQCINMCISNVVQLYVLYLLTDCPMPPGSALLWIDNKMVRNGGRIVTDENWKTCVGLNHGSCRSYKQVR